MGKYGGYTNIMYGLISGRNAMPLLAIVFFTAAARFMLFCLVYWGGVVPLLQSISSLKEYPIYRDLPAIQFDIIHANPNSSYPVSVVIP